MEETENGGVIAEARKLVEDYLNVDVREIVEPETGVEALVVVGADGLREVPRSIFDSYRNEPRRRDGIARLTKIESLIEHVNRFKDGDSIIFAIDDRATPSLTAVLDYHESVAGASAEARPRFGTHRAVFAFPLSDEWKAWNAANAKAMPMAAFAAFLEDRIVDVIDLIPSEDSLPENLMKYINLCGGEVGGSAKLVEISRGLKVHEKGVVEEQVNPATGEVTFNFVSEHVDARGQKLKIPNVFLIGIPVFKHGPLYRIAARLRYRKASEGLVFWYELWRADAAFDDAFAHACERVRVETELPLLFGQPE